MADVHVMPGVERHDLGVDVPIETLINGVRDGQLTRMIVVGYGREGFYLASSSADLDRNIGMLMRAIHDMLHTETAEMFSTEPA